MNKQATFYEVDGRVYQITPNNGTDFTLEEMYGIVGSPIDILSLPKTNEIMIINDEGKISGLAKNDLATEVFKRAYPIGEYPGNNDELIVGTVIVCDSSMVK